MLAEGGLVRATSGSASLRWQDQCYISPAGARLDRLSAADFIPLSVEGHNTWQLARASADHRLHLACYRARPDAQTVLLIHPPNCIALGCAGLSLGALTPDFYRAVGAAVPLLPYHTPGAQALAAAVAEQIARHNAVLLRNCGLILAAGSSDEALLHSQMVEEAARAVLLAHAAAGECSFLTAEQIEELEQANTSRPHG
jgi:L-fuculose-phosphate aldolase